MQWRLGREQERREGEPLLVCKINFKMMNEQKRKKTFARAVEFAQCQHPPPPVPLHSVIEQIKDTGCVSLCCVSIISSSRTHQLCGL